MSTITFSCESITPILMHGADGKTELRPASIKGILRFWWRAIHGDLPLKELKEKKGEIFGSMDKKSSFGIKIQRYESIPKQFTIQFLNYRSFDIQSFFELVVILGLFGQKGKGKQKTQGSIKVLKINNEKYTKTIDLNYINTLIENFSSNYSKKKFKIEQKKIKEEYPLVKDISVSKDNKLYINFIHSSKLQTIKKNLGNYNG